MVLGVVACNREEIKHSEFACESEADEMNYSAEISTNEWDLNTNDFLLIANTHNEVLAQSIDNINWTSTDHTSEIRSYYTNLVSDEFGIDPASYNSLLGNIQNLQSETFTLLSNNQDFKTIYNEIIEIGNSNLNYNEITFELEELQNLANFTLSGRDLDAAFLMIETSKKSASFWLPTEQDGTGIGHDFLEDYWEDNDLPGAPDIGKAMAIDGLGASHYFLLIGLMLVPTPLSLGGIIVAVGTHAAFASLAYVVSAM